MLIEAAHTLHRSPPEHPEIDRVRLAGRGTTFVREVPGPPGAPTVVLLHGWFASGGLNWYRVFGPLSEHFRVIAPDLRGHGESVQSTNSRIDLSPDRLRPADFQAMVSADMEELRRFLREEHNNERLNLDRLGLGAASKALQTAPIESLVDTLAAACPFETAEKQALLEAPDLKSRADVLVALAEMELAANGGGTGGGTLQ